ncbi:ABC transporter permease [Melittangium boletus]|uniref:ABC transporter permease n=1 Tax=Melittangium boletus DSM 14713 TaxID=1294270 RepID=A0A250ICR9_9BACT|nr:ABC transporter permease [Melittangium boletus]ATB28746.1 ABC transporter permease [Melittangium boletus DSM 14713]
MHATTGRGMDATVNGEPRPPLLSRLGEWLNPLVVKEVRQGVRSRVFWSFFGLMLLACFTIALAAWSSTLEEGGLKPMGRSFFFAFFVCLGVVHFFVIPYSAYRSLAREREDDTWVLLILTGLGPRRILRGKVGSFLVQGGLYASAVGPFLLFSYYLNGIELPTILVVLALGGCWLVFLTVWAVCAATMAEGRIGRALVHFSLLGSLALALMYGLVSAFALCEEGFLLFRRERFLVYFAGCFLWMMLTGGWLLFETAAARLSLVTENYSRGPRLALVVQVGLSGLVLLGGWLYVAPDRGAEVVSVLGCLYLTLCGLVLATDADGQARALRAGTRPWSLLRPGAVRGLRLAVLLLLAWSALCGVLLWLSPSGSSWREVTLEAVLAPPVFALLYMTLPVWVVRLPRAGRSASAAVVRFFFFILVLLASMLPPFVAILFGESGGQKLFNLLNPFVGLSAFLEGSYRWTAPELSWSLWAVVALLAGLSVFLADRTLVARERQAHAS